MCFFAKFLGCIIFLITTLQGQIGYFCVPVADLVAQPFAVSDKQSVAALSVAALYDAISISPEQGKDSCLRIHQGIFNEQVIILGYKNQQVYIELTNCFFQPMPGQGQQPTRLWTRSDWVISEQELDESSIAYSIFPEPIRYDDFSCSNQDCVTLLLPWYDSVTDTVYCAGTRFVLAKKRSVADEYTICLYNPHTHQVVLTSLPKNVALPASFETSEDQRRAFVELLQVWCSLDGEIPFVWGGTSFNYICQDHYARLEEEYKNGVYLAYWNRPSIKQHPYCGFDASGLILRAAQIVGAPYFCINSTTIANNLRPLHCGEILEEGDILWSPGYVGVVGSIERNELIEAQGYARGYGKVQAITLKKRFNGIYSWKDFLYFYNQGLPLQSLNSDGKIVNSVSKYTLFKFPSQANKRR